MSEILSDILFCLTYVVEWALEQRRKKSDAKPDPAQAQDRAGPQRPTRP